MLEVADIFRAAGPAYRDKYGSQMLPSHLTAMRDIEQCRTEALGGHVSVCDHCHEERFHYHSCRNRHCPKCHGDQTQRWVEQQRERLLPCPYYLLTFTLPSELRPLARSNQRDVYGLLLRGAADSVLKLTADPRWVGARPGILAVLHTWTQAMVYHPHAHLLVTSGGWSDDESCWYKPGHERFLVSGRALSAIFRAKVKCALYDIGLFREVPVRAWEQPWVVHCQPAGNGGRVLDYLARYVYRIAITNHRLERFCDGQVTLRYRNRRTGKTERCTVAAEEFIRRFLQHVLPRGFTKVRYYGIFSSACSPQLEQARTVLAVAAAASVGGPPTTSTVSADADARNCVTPSPVDVATAPEQPRPDRRCTSCGIGRLRWLPLPFPKKKPP